MSTHTDPLERLRHAAAEFGDALADVLRRSSAPPVSLGPTADLNVAGLAALFGKRPSTIRGWLERGDFPNAYKLPGKEPTRCEWRVPTADVETFRLRQQRRAPRWWARPDDPAA